MKPGFKVFVSSSLGLLLVDQLVKVWARSVGQGTEGQSLAALWPNVFEIKLVFNEGVAFGMMQGAGIYLTPVALAIAALSAWFSWKHPENPTISHVTCALLAAGSLGNLADRLIFGKVTDMFWFRAINFPVFNFADVCITVAGALFVLAAIRDSVRKSPGSLDATSQDGPT